MKETNRVSILNTILIIIGSIITTGMVIYFSRGTSNKGKVESTKNSKYYYLSGTVVDEVTNNSISQAKVSVIGGNEYDYTQINGNFKILFKDSISQVRIRVIKAHYKVYDQSYNVPDNVIIPLTSNASH